ncbi:MAG: Uma2 family endonuclease [Planctomycetales bacterium]|nr:Uma2 family endonuclease [Planctomycetales bacterium]
MASEIEITTRASQVDSPGVPVLRNGDHLTSTEFLRRYHAMPHVTQAELVEGRVFMPSPVSAERHGEPHFDMLTWLGVYRAATPGVLGGDNSTISLDLDNAPQPDGYLRIVEQAGGHSRIDDGYLIGAPELIVEVAASSASYDLHDKRQAYRRNGVREYLIWRTEDRAIDWLVLDNGDFEPMLIDNDGVLRSRAMPGLWLDPAAALRGDLAGVLATLSLGLATPEHQQFVEMLRAKLSDG